MKIVVIGSTGTIGAAVVRALSSRHEVIGLHRTSDPPLDITQRASIEKVLSSLADIDAVVSCAGGAAWKPLGELTDDDFAMSLGNKLMGQVNVIRTALARVRDNGSITVTTGILARTPMEGSAAVSLVNAGLEGFVRAAQLEAPRGIRVNVVAPPWVTETLRKFGMDESIGLPADVVARSYVQAVEGTDRGATIEPKR